MKKVKILVDTDIRKQVQKTFGCTATMVSLALNGHKDTELARRIRKRALDLGGREKGTENVKQL